MSSDQHFMERAIELAKRGGGWVAPNPQVGCVIVQDGRIIGEGWHAHFGEAHAERRALSDCAARMEDAHGSTAYVTLEPCGHTGKTPPCSSALVEAGVSRVVIGSSDPNPLVSGLGIRQLRDAGVHVDEGVLREECDELNAPFFTHIRTGRPFVIAKYAMTLDGKVATREHLSQWITGKESRRRVHEDRARYASVMVGIGTVLADDPLLTARTENEDAHQPLRVVCDARLRIPQTSKLVQTSNMSPTLIFTSSRDEERIGELRQAGCEVMHVSEVKDGHLDLGEALDVLGSLGINSVIVEGGPELTGSLFDGKLVDRVQAYIAPKIFGGADAPTSVAGRGVASPANACLLERKSVISLGTDILIEGDVVYV